MHLRCHIGLTLDDLFDVLHARVRSATSNSPQRPYIYPGRITKKTTIAPMHPQPQLSAGILPRQLVGRLGVPTAVRAIMQPRLHAHAASAACLGCLLQPQLFAASLGGLGRGLAAAFELAHVGRLDATGCAVGSQSLRFASIGGLSLQVLDHCLREPAAGRGGP